MFITSACVSGPIIEGIQVGAAVNSEYSGNLMKIYELDNMRFDLTFDIEERKEEYSNEELNGIYNNKNIQEQENLYYEKEMRNNLNSYWKSTIDDEEQGYWDLMAREQEEREKELREEEEEAIRYEHFLGKIHKYH